LATIVGSPSAPHFVDWGCQPGSTTYYRVTAVDRHGNQSEPSAPVKAVTDAVPDTPVRIELEAEEGELETPMRVAQSPSASGGAYVHVPDDHSDEPYVLEGLVRIPFELPQAGVYVFWARVMGLDGASNSFYVLLDDSPPFEWDFKVPRKGTPKLGWTRIPALDGVPLRAGGHQVIVRSREDGARLDKIVITNDRDTEPGR